MGGNTPSAWQPPSIWTEKEGLEEGRSWRWSRFLRGEEVQTEIAAVAAAAVTATRPLSPRAWGHCSGDWMGGWTIQPFCRRLCAATAVRRHPPTPSSVGPVQSSTHQTTQHLNTQRRWTSSTSSWDSTVRGRTHCAQTHTYTLLQYYKDHRL